MTTRWSESLLYKQDTQTTTTVRNAPSPQTLSIFHGNVDVKLVFLSDVSLRLPLLMYGA